MSQLDYNTSSRKGKHLNSEERLKIEALKQNRPKAKGNRSTFGQSQQKDNIQGIKIRRSGTSERQSDHQKRI